MTQPSGEESFNDFVEEIKNTSGYTASEAIQFDGESVIWASERIKELQLENENLSKTILTLSAPPMLTSLESDEEIHQQRRRERMLDEITLSSVRGFMHLHAEEKTYRQIGVSARDRAEDICRGIDEFDAR